MSPGGRAVVEADLFSAGFLLYLVGKGGDAGVLVFGMEEIERRAGAGGGGVGEGQPGAGVPGAVLSEGEELVGGVGEGYRVRGWERQHLMRGHDGG